MSVFGKRNVAVDLKMWRNRWNITNASVFRLNAHQYLIKAVTRNTRGEVKLFFYKDLLNILINVG